MLRFPHAKINIGLFITGKREDGYHNLETIFYPVEVKDALEIIPAKATTMQLSGLPVTGDTTQNLIWKAYQLLSLDFPEQIQPLEIHLHKVIPMGAGLGGGSADGAFMLSMLSDFFNLAISKEKLEYYALELGSDCPFFIQDNSVFATGRGEIMQPINVKLDDYSIQLICPELHISTAQAFNGIKPQPASFELNKLLALPIETWKDFVVNDFEASLFPHYPVLGSIKDQLYEQGAIYASLSGTGSTVYGIFKKGQQATIHIDTPFRSFNV
jgi:4-diphosphocytidyl-2-C-methyl-D-erythritol kinase